MRWAATILAGAVVAVGCNGGGGFVPGGDSDTGPIGLPATCTTTADCGAGRWCRLGLCADGSPGDADSSEPCACSGLQTCETATGMCLDAEICATDADCVGTNECVSGQCVEPVGCRSDAACGANASCVAGVWECAPDSCDDVTAPCPVPLKCHALGFCADCAVDGDCPGAQTCNAGSCESASPCSDDVDCVLGRVCTATSCSLPDCTDDAFTPNADLASAATIAPGDHAPTVCQFVRDYLRVDLAVGDGVLARLNWERSLGIIFANIYDLDENLIAGREGEAGSLNLGIESVPTAGVILELWADTGYLIPADLTVQRFEGGVCFNDLREPTDLRLEAIEVESNPVLAEVPLTLCPGDQDWLETTVSASAFLDVMVDVLEQAQAPIVEVYEEGGAGLVLKDASTNPSKLLTVENTGLTDQIYVVRVAAPAGQTVSSQVVVTLDAR